MKEIDKRDIKARKKLLDKWTKKKKRRFDTSLDKLDKVSDKEKKQLSRPSKVTTARKANTVKRSKARLRKQNRAISVSSMWLNV